MLRGRSWSANGGIRQVDVSTDGGQSWRPARRIRPGVRPAWQRWELRWRPPAPGGYELLARATDVTDARQPDTTPFNTFGYLFGGIVRHPVTAT